MNNVISATLVFFSIKRKYKTAPLFETYTKFNPDVIFAFITWS